MDHLGVELGDDGVQGSQLVWQRPPGLGIRLPRKMPSSGRRELLDRRTARGNRDRDGVAARHLVPRQRDDEDAYASRGRLAHVQYAAGRLSRVTAHAQDLTRAMGGCVAAAGGSATVGPVSASPGAKRALPLTFDGIVRTVFGRPIGGGDILPAAATVTFVSAVALIWTLVAYRAGPLIAVALPLVVALLVLIAMRPMAGAYLGVLCVPLEQMGFASGAADVTPAKGLLFYTGVVAACHFLGGARRARPHPGHIAFGGLLLVGVLGLAVTDDSLTTVKILAQWTSYLGLSMYVATVDRAQLERLVGCIVLAGAVVGAAAILTAGDQQVVAGGQAATGRAQASFDHPATLAFFLILAFPPALILGFRSGKLARLPAFAAAGLCIGGIMLSLTRGAILGAVFAMLVLLFWAEFRRLAVVVLVAIFAFSAFNLKAIEQSPEVRVIGARLQTITDTRATSDNERTKIWSKTPALIADYPFFGVGAGNFSAVSARYGIVGTFGDSFGHAHDVMLTIAAEFGLLGLALFTFFAGSLVRDAGRAIARDRASPSYPLVLGLAAALGGLFVNGVTDYPPGTLVIMGTLMAEIGAFIGYTRVVADERAGQDASVSLPADAQPERAALPVR